jgi:hypothetical protein
VPDGRPLLLLAGETETGEPRAVASAREETHWVKKHLGRTLWLGRDA